MKVETIPSGLIQCDVLVIGSGIAGLATAIQLAEHNRDLGILVITKDEETESNTRYAQGGVAAVMDQVNDSFEDHIKDTLRAGDGLCNPEVVSLVVKEGPERIREVIELGASFDQNVKGKLDLGREGGHSIHRIVHHKDITGFELERALINRLHTLENVSLLPRTFSIDLITEHHFGKEVNRHMKDIHCFGAYAMRLDDHKILTIASNVTILASGGSGQVYEVTTNPPVATGDGIAMAYRAKAILSNMAYIQFHPTALFEPGVSPAFLISEAVRGFGAILRNHKEEDFVLNYDERGSLASRDIVSRAIDSEMKKYGLRHVYLDCRHLDQDAFYKHFPNIIDKCKSIGYHPATSLIPVVPAAHYMCGGIDVDLYGRTSVNNLYCIGESACTGLHGANRLASNSLLEALVYAHRCAKDILSGSITDKALHDVPLWNNKGTTRPREIVMITHNIDELKRLMADFAGIVRSEGNLKYALRKLEDIYLETENHYNNNLLSPQLCELRNMINVAYIIITQSLQCTENRGAFYSDTLCRAN